MLAMAELVTKRCNTCGFRSAHAETFRLERCKGRRRPVRVCFGCSPVALDATQEKALGRRWANLLVWTILAGNYGLQHGRVDAVAIFCLALLVAGPLTTIMHEAAHAGVAALVGFRVLSVEIGQGPQTRLFRIGQTRWILRRYLSLSGITLFIPTQDATTPQRLAVYAAGAAVNLALGLGAFALAMALNERLYGSLWLTAMLMGVAVSNLWSGVQVLWPTYDAAGPDSDGAKILQLLRGEATGASAKMDDELAFLVSIYRLTETGRLAEAADALEAKLTDWPNDPYLLSMLVHCVSRAEGDAAALARYRAVVDTAPSGPPPRPNLRQNPRSLLAANLAWSTVKTGGDLDFADAQAEASFADTPELPEVRGTIGAVRVARGEVVEGERLLTEAVRKIGSSIDRAAFCAFIAKARRARGDAAGAEEADRLSVHVLARSADPVPV